MREARPRAEACQRLSVGELRRLAAPGAQSLTLADGQALALQWRPVVGCYGGRGQALLIGCPVCGAWGRVLWCPPGQGWGCWRCRPVSHRSHRRPGGGRWRIFGKGPDWHRQQIADEQDRIAEMLGLQRRALLMGRVMDWRPDRLFWTLRDIQNAPRRPDAPRLSARRRDALERRLDALESARLLAVMGGLPGMIGPNEGTPRLMAIHSRLELEESRWAMRRPPRDPRTIRGAMAAAPEPQHR